MLMPSAAADAVASAPLQDYCFYAYAMPHYLHCLIDSAIA